MQNRDIEEYKLVTSDNPAVFNELVMVSVIGGWQPYGAAFYNTHNATYAQVMVKYV